MELTRRRKAAALAVAVLVVGAAAYGLLVFDRPSVESVENE